MTVPTHQLAPPAPSEARESLIVLSDVHLGSDLVSYAPSGITPARTKQVDEDLVRLLDHYRSHPPPTGSWRLVIAGDLIDFIGMVLAPDQSTLRTEPTAEERAHGLGNAEDHAAWKMRAVAVRHLDVFATLARFVADGHALTIIRGNHDLELHWEAVQSELREILVAHAQRAVGESFDREAFLARLDFSPWFFFQDGVAYIEHGHQYDRFCSTDHLLAPLSPIDPRRIARGFSDVLLRFVVRQTARLSEHGHESRGVLQYLAIAWRLGVGGGLALARRYVLAIRELFRVRHAYLTGATVELRRQHEAAMATLAHARRVSLERVRALYEMRVPPITRTISGILGSLLVDRLMLGAGCAMLLLVIALVSVWHGDVAWAALSVPMLWLVVRRVLTRQRHIESEHELALRAPALARLFGAPFVVMGHTHVAAREDLGGATYINLGSWAESEGELRASRSHLVIHPGDTGPTAELLSWDALRGPLRFEAPG
jgi:UDP-2,3-diacylglucosamine pyrophosphatase LpxH